MLVAMAQFNRPHITTPIVVWSNRVCILYHFWDARRWIMTFPWTLGYGSFKGSEVAPWSCHCKHSYISYRFWDSWRWKNIVTLKFRLEVTHSANLCTICRAYFAEIIRTRRYLIAADIIGLSSFTSTQRAPKKLSGVRLCITVVQGHSRSYKWIPIESTCANSY